VIKMKYQLIIPALLAIAVAGCSSGGSSFGTASAPATTGSALATTGSGPFQITLDSCTAQSLQQGSGSALTGSVTVKNVSNSVTAMVQVDMNFTNGSAVVGTGFTDESAQLSPGQSEQLKAPAMDHNGNALTSATGCQPTTYLVTDSPGQPGTYYPWH
jgi:hypothetical protein